MIKNFNEWYIDVNLAPQEGQIEKRLECIADYAKSVDANDICNLVNLYYGLTTDKEDLESFASVFIEKDPSFSSRYTKELSLLAGATLLEISTENIDYSSFAELLTLTTSFYKKPSSALRALEQIIKRFNIDRIAIREKNFTDDTLDFDKANLKTVATTINKPSWDATSAQNLIHVLGECVDYLQAIYLPTQYSIEKDLDSKISILIDLFSSNYEFLEMTDIVDTSTVSGIIDLLYNKSHQDAITLIIKLCGCTMNQIGKSAVNHLSEILTTKDFSSLLKQSKNAALWLMSFNLNLALCEDAWKQDKNIQLEILKQLKDSFSNVNYTGVNYKSILYLIFETSDVDIISDLYKTFGDCSVDAFFDWCETEHACIQKSIRWVNLCKYNQILSIERLKHINNPRLFETVIKVLDPYNEKMKEIPKETWELFYRRFCVNNSSGNINTVFAQFILPIIIESSSQFSTQLTEFAFITVHNILAHDEMDYGQWNRLSKLLPDNSQHNVWDKCKCRRRPVLS